MLQFIKLAIHYSDTTNWQTQAKSWSKIVLFISKDELSFRKCDTHINWDQANLQDSWIQLQSI